MFCVTSNQVSTPGSLPREVLGSREQGQEEDDEEDADDTDEVEEAKREGAVRKKGLQCVAEAALGLGEMAAGPLTW